jgi:hypothetical protein
MITIKIELWPGGREHLAREIGRMYIANDGAGTAERGDYKVAVCRRGSTEVPREIYPDADQLIDIAGELGERIKKAPKATRAGEVKDYPRLAYNVWRLVARAALAAFPEEDRPATKRGTVFDGPVARGFRQLADKYLRRPGDDNRADLMAALEWISAADRDDK